MLPEIKTILYASDMGDHMRPVFRHAVSLAKQYNAKLVMLHILEPISQQSRLAIQAYLPKDQAEELEAKGLQDVRDKMHKRLMKFCEDELSDAEGDLMVDFDVVHGRPAETIVREAERLEADMIVMGTHTDTSFGAHLLGSQARKVTQMARRPVLVVPVYGKQ
jgi:nucleotide-binding universal stress UspA family protein